MAQQINGNYVARALATNNRSFICMFGMEELRNCWLIMMFC